MKLFEGRKIEYKIVSLDTNPIRLDVSVDGSYAGGAIGYRTPGNREYISIYPDPKRPLGWYFRNVDIRHNEYLFNLKWSKARV